jgi:hypothetical protein
MKSNKLPRTKIMGVRLNKVENAKLEIASVDAGVSIGKYVRNKLFGYE